MRTRRTSAEPPSPPAFPNRGPGSKSKGLEDEPKTLPPVPDAPPDEALALVEKRATELEAICATALASGLGLRTATRLILSEHGPSSKNAAARGWAYDKRQVWTTLKRLSDEWEQDFKETAAAERARQVERLRQDLARQRAKANPSFQAIRGHEELLGRIMGTLQPIRVEVDVIQSLKVSLAAVIVDMTEDERDALVREQLELEALARSARPVIDTAAE